MSTTCPSCGNASAGRYCPDCGVALNATCRECQNPLPLGARFCNDCGVSVAAPAAAASRRPIVPWAVAGLAVAALAGVLLFRTADEPAAQPAAAPAGPFAQAGAPAGDPSAVDLSSMTPKEQADRLFNRALSTEAGGDTAQARFFANMGVQAYGQVQPQDNDVRYHLSELYRVQGDAAGVKAQADAILASEPTHLFGLFAAGRAEAMGGNAAGARTFYRRFLDAYGTEVSRNLPEYRDHQQALPSMRAEAEKLAAQ